MDEAELAKYQQLKEDGLILDLDELLKVKTWPRWMDEADVDEYSEYAVGETRGMARAILVFMKHLALHNYVTRSYWGLNVYYCVSEYDDEKEPGMGAYVSSICERLLQRLEVEHFW